MREQFPISEPDHEPVEGVVLDDQEFPGDVVRPMSTMDVASNRIANQTITHEEYQDGEAIYRRPTIPGRIDMKEPGAGMHNAQLVDGDDPRLRNNRRSYKSEENL